MQIIIATRDIWRLWSRNYSTCIAVYWLSKS